MAATTTETPNGAIGDVLRQIEERLQRLEEQMATMAGRPQPGPQAEPPWWKRFTGVFEGSEVYESVVRRIQRNRRADYARAAAEGKGRQKKLGGRAKRRKTTK